MVKRLSLAAIGLAVLLGGCAAQPKKEVTHPLYGKELWIAVTPLKGIQDVAVNGVAIAHYFTDGTYLATVQLNTDLAKQGTHYEVWLTRESPRDSVSIGELSSPLGDGRYRLQYAAKKDLRAYTKILVALQQGTANDKQGLPHAEGTLEQR